MAKAKNHLSKFFLFAGKESKISLRFITGESNGGKSDAFSFSCLSRTSFKAADFAQLGVLLKLWSCFGFVGGVDVASFVERFLSKLFL
ncbi:hypothetical protein MHBO_002734 [Bonamia ostreae]|uniref:Uncharacterized protein n=1 Tax=Bonamia ostreae TaxID=126728 RepID=A0ABV2AND2_9EUKA